MRRSLENTGGVVTLVAIGNNPRFKLATIEIATGTMFLASENYIAAVNIGSYREPNWGNIIGTIAGGLAGLFAIPLIIVFIFCVGYKTKLFKQKLKQQEMEALLHSDYLMMGEYNTNPEKVEPDSKYIPFEELTFKDRLSEGSFGVVFSGLYRKSPVAIKMLKQAGDITPFIQEVTILNSLRYDVF